ncbi:MAG: GNAT family N-acetyltransferase [Halobacteriales archaeon]|nr:GNAT family N-acetyltransferase [Halobacteriales archaeon]
MEIREAMPEDGDAVRQVAQSAMEAAYPLSPSAIDGVVTSVYGPESIARKSNDESVIMLVAEDDGETIGLIEGVTVDGNGDIRWLHVDPMRRGEGVARALHDAITERLYERDVNTIRARVLAESTTGNAFFERLGYTKVGQSRIEIDNTDHIENVYVDEIREDFEAITGPEGQELFVDHDDADRGSKGLFLALYADTERERRYGYYCENCRSPVTVMDPMGGLECRECGNAAKPSRWDAAYI